MQIHVLSRTHVWACRSIVRASWYCKLTRVQSVTRYQKNLPCTLHLFFTRAHFGKTHHFGKNVEEGPAGKKTVVCIGSCIGRRREDRVRQCPSRRSCRRHRPRGSRHRAAAAAAAHRPYHASVLIYQDWQAQGHMVAVNCLVQAWQQLGQRTLPSRRPRV